MSQLVDAQLAPSRFTPLHEILMQRSGETPSALAFRFLPDGGTHEETLTYGELAVCAGALASEIAARGAAGKPVLLVHPPGLDFLTGLFACWHAGAIAVPCYPPRGSRHRTRLSGILQDSGARLAIGPTSLELPAGVTVISPSTNLDWVAPATSRSGQPCLLQYTSGSTADPKGVLVTHENLRSHFAAVRALNLADHRSIVSWLPPYHDMGLVLKILFALEAGIPLTFFPPEHFIQRPVRWLRAISRFSADLSAAPNFAFELCLRSIRDDELEGLDLSSWRTAPCGAERVQPQTLDRFAERFEPYGFHPEAFAPGYGLAEATLTVAVSPAGRPYRRIGDLVSCGAPLPGISVRVVDPATGRPCTEGKAGEILVSGPTVATGYWQEPELTEEVFGEAAAPELRTGDLGFLQDGELYVTGRIKDIIIIDGTNISPEDIESLIVTKIPSVVAAAAFPAASELGESVVVALEATGDFDEIRRAVRRLIGDALEIPVGRVVFTRPGLLPRTTSGKIRRSACREALEGGSLKLRSDEIVATSTATTSDKLTTVLATVAEITGRIGIRPEDDLLALGMGSMDVTRLAASLHRTTGKAVTIGDLFAAHSIAEIAAAIEDSGKEPVAPSWELTAEPTLTHSQERMWFLHQLDSKSAAYHVFGAVELCGPLDVQALELAIRSVVANHEIFRSRFRMDDGKLIVSKASSDVDYQKCKILSEIELDLFLQDFSNRPFDLAESPPVRVCVIDCQPNRHILAVCAHHIVADGWSLRLLAEEIATAYAGVPQVPSESYWSHAAWHRQWIDSGAVDDQVAYWKAKLAGHPGVIRLPVDFPAPQMATSEGGVVEVDLAVDLSNRVAAVARAHRATPFMVHLAAFLLLLRNHGAGDDLVVAVPVANRHHPSAAGVIGTLVNTLPFRLAVDPTESFSALLVRVREATFEMQAAQDAPFEKIIEAVQAGRSRDHAPLAQVMCDFQEIPMVENWAGGIECRPFTAHRGAVQFDLNLLVKVLRDRHRLSLEYRSELFRPETATALLARFIETLEQATNTPGQSPSEICQLTVEDHKWLETKSAGPTRDGFANIPATALIARRTALHPHRTAITAGDTTLDYATLDARATALAATLYARGVRVGDRIGILLERDDFLPVALLATWRVGAAYVPLDAANPAERLALILEDQQPLSVLVSPSLVALLPENAMAIVSDDSLLTSAPDFEAHVSVPSDPAYVIYTSGSTGRPKGVVVSHGALANFLLSMAEAPGFTEADRLLAVTTVSFDISLLEIFLPLVMGGSVDIVPAEVARDGSALLARLESTAATVLQATPSTWRMLLEAGWTGSPDLKILCGGEPLDLPLARALRPMGYELWNLYGPTETTVWSTIWQVPDHPLEISVGRPIANTGIHIRAADGTIAPPGVIGELWISGDGLADGYWQRPELTAKVFASLTDGTPAYNTGDLARWRSDGTMECLGRSDNQVKIRGFRVELGEIESAMSTHPAVAQAKVVLRGSERTSQRLVGWVITRSELKISGLRDFLQEILPTYMIPSDIGIVHEFPLNSNGKVDVSQLASPAEISHSTAPLTATEVLLAAIWEDLLQRPSVGKHDNWFHVGGHSLLALRLFARIHREFCRRLPLSAILAQPTLAGLATIIDESPMDAAP